MNIWHRIFPPAVRDVLLSLSEFEFGFLWPWSWPLSGGSDEGDDERRNNLIVLLIIIYFGLLLPVISTNAGKLFSIKRQVASRHRLSGGLLLIWLLVGYFLVFDPSVFSSQFSQNINMNVVITVYDVLLSSLGAYVAYSAAEDFKWLHRNVKNKASGVLDREATVTYNEMIEHVFYQILNLVQILFLHLFSFASDLYINNFNNIKDDDEKYIDTVSKWLVLFVLGVVVTSPWLYRKHFPVNSFQNNYNNGQEPLSLISVLYRTKKYQYIFYKHFMLHGLNMSILFFADVFSKQSPSMLIHHTNFRLYWLNLNVSYVMEFFMQTLVKKGYMSQEFMILLQHILMLASTIAALAVLRYILVIPAIVSMFLNFVNRGKEMQNFCCSFVICCMVVWTYRAI